MAAKQDENGFDVPQPVAVSASPASQRPQQPDIGKILAPVNMTANDMALSYESDRKMIKEARIQQLARDHVEVRELLDELEQLRAAQ